jgi:ABC-type uncharacterized transport system permease subunit
MQRTRLNLLFDENLDRLSRFFQNPWRKIALVIIAVLFGNLLATVFPPSIGQTPTWDPIVAAAITLLAEGMSFFYYRLGDRQQSRSKLTSPKSIPRTQFILDLLNAFKIGLLYGLIVSAINVGS